MTTRSVAVTVGVALLILSSGCAATQEEFRFESTPGTVAEDALSEAGYETAQEGESLTVNRTVDAGGQERDVTVVNYASAYAREVSVAGQSRTLAGAAVFTTPSISFVGQEFNPVADQSNEELLDQAQSRVEGQIDGGGVEDVEFVENRTATILGEEATVGVFSGTTTVQGTEIELRILVTKVKHEDDFVIVAGAYPEALASDERPRLETVFDNVEHDA